jgi:hypothetical protein
VVFKNIADLFQYISRGVDACRRDLVLVDFTATSTAVASDALPETAQRHLVAGND